MELHNLISHYLFTFIRLYYMENGLKIATKTFSEIEKIYLLEFINSDEKLLIVGRDKKEEKLIIIIWDLYHTGKVVPMKLDDFPSTKNIGTRFARTSGNI